MAPRPAAAALRSVALVLPSLLLAVVGAGLSGYFGTKSRYEEVNPHLERDPLSLGPSAAASRLPAACAPLQLRAVLRHGTRFPTAGQIRRLRELHGRVLRRPAAACPAAAAVAAWQMWYEESLDGRLAPQGRRDMELLARRLAARFPALFAARRRLLLASSSKHRCLQSGAAFRRGLGPSLSLDGDGNPGHCPVPAAPSDPAVTGISRGLAASHALRAAPGREGSHPRAGGDPAPLLPTPPPGTQPAWGGCPRGGGCAAAPGTPAGGGAGPACIPEARFCFQRRRLKLTIP